MDMSNTITKFSTASIFDREFPIYGTKDEPYFRAKDVAEWIDYDTSSLNKMLAGVDDGEKVRKNLPTPSGVQEVWFVSEDGLYEMLFLSRKPKAKMFKQGVKAALKQIRLTGGYIPVAPEETPEETMAKAFLIATETIKQREQRIKMLAEDNARKQALLEEQKPKVVFADAIVGGKTNILVRDLAKIIQQNGYEIGEKRLFIWLRENKYLTTSNMPMQRYVEMGLFFVDEGSHSESGVMKCHFTTKVTPKGQQYFINKFLGGA